MRTVYNPSRDRFVPVHGHSVANSGDRSPTYISWQNMHARCRYSSVPSYSNYGGRGIRVCDRWSDFSAFLEDMGERPDGTTIDRLNSNGDYTPDNCRWATRKEQNDPTRARSLRGLGFSAAADVRTRRMSAKQFADHYGVSLATIYRARSGESWR